MTTHTLHIYATQKTKNSQQSVYLHVPVNIIDSAFPLSLNEMVLALGCSVYDTVQNYDNGWSTVTNYTYSGWMKTENIKLPSDNATNMVISQTSSEDGSKLGTVKVSDGLNVRASASKSADIIGSLSNGTVVTILDESTAGWYKVKVNNITGWVSSDYVTVK
jgi:mannosyl-glycoprotein endo-beta-N-acetylglucosaminidase